MPLEAGHWVLVFSSWPKAEEKASKREEAERMEREGDTAGREGNDHLLSALPTWLHAGGFAVTSRSVRCTPGSGVLDAT